MFSDFISLELYEGRPRLLINFGSGTLELNVQTKQPINDGEWHRIDIFWQSQVLQMLKKTLLHISSFHTKRHFNYNEYSCFILCTCLTDRADVSRPLQIG